ncbi:hypothetical protein WR25_21759 [Diploscapter pachys]|uniref:Uncharacterized protein n=1 Tax=Diploscapter pachys TaxID=2018661 RepID=A0A2A2J8L1_9BILA|nr:hypothetical protein WR25_21759 [Diploscapter pachys]
MSRISRLTRMTHPDAATRPADEAEKPVAAQGKGTPNEKDAYKEFAEKADGAKSSMQDSFDQRQPVVAWAKRYDEIKEKKVAAPNEEYLTLHLEADGNFET